MAVGFETRDGRDGSWSGPPAGVRWLFSVVFLLTAAVGSGCDSDPFAPPPPPDELRVDSPSPAASGPGADAISVAPEARSIELVLDRHDPDESEIFKSAARVQAGRERVRLRITALEIKDLSSRQAELVRQAVERRPVAVILEPADPADARLAKAVSEASAVVPVFVLYRPLEALAKDASAATGRVIVVAPPAFAESAGRLVASAMRNAKNANLDPKAGAILAINTVGDPFLDDRVAAIRDQLKAAGVTNITEIRFATKVEDCVKLVSERLKKDLKPSLVFGVDSASLAGCREASNQLVDERPFITAGYTADEQTGSNAKSGDLAAVADFMPTRLVRKAIAAAAAAVDGKPIPEKLELTIEFHDSPPDSGLPRTQSFYKSRQNLPTSPDKR